MSQYGEWTLVELKGELKRRGARQSGRKHELVERLEAYDRNCGFGRTPTNHASVVYKMDLPLDVEYRNINADTVMPPITRENTRAYLSTYNTFLEEKVIDLYNEDFLLCVRKVSLPSKSYVKARCAAEMKKKTVYNVDISLTSDGAIMECQCECAAGMGPNAHCKHVKCLLYGLLQFAETSNIRTQTTCTQRLQSFHKTKKFVGSPVKAKDLNVTCSTSERTLAKNTGYDTRLPQYIDQPGAIDRVNSLVLNFHANNSVTKMPYLQKIQAANVRALAHDHDYMSTTQEDWFLGLLSVNNPISDCVQKQIEINTRGQADNKVWVAERSMRLTSSNFGRICKATDRTNLHELACSFVRPKSLSPAPLKHGKTYEPVARKKYVQITGSEVTESGLIVCVKLPYLCASPDGGIKGTDGILEIKCPYASKDKMIDSSSVPYLYYEGDTLKLKEQHNYHYQVQGQMLCSGASYCDFVVYRSVDFKIIRILRNDNFISSMTQKLKKFFFENSVPVILQKFFYRD